MKKKTARFVALILCLLCVVPIAYGLWRIVTSNGYQFIDAPFYFFDGKICDASTGEEFSIEQYYHPNAEISLWSDPIVYQLDGITYVFSLEDVEHPEITFLMDEKEHKIYDDGEAIFIRKASGVSFFNKEIEVCLLPTEASFYTPISVNGLDDYAILVFDSEYNDRESVVTIWNYVNNEWTQGEFLFPDGNSSNRLFGRVRRHFNYNNDLDAQIGHLEVRLSGADGEVLYDVSYLEGTFSLTPVKPVSQDELLYWLF